jgi:hypothetical protein
MGVHSNKEAKVVKYREVEGLLIVQWMDDNQPGTPRLSGKYMTSRARTLVLIKRELYFRCAWDL